MEALLLSHGLCLWSQLWPTWRVSERAPHRRLLRRSRSARALRSDGFTHLETRGWKRYLLCFRLKMSCRIQRRSLCSLCMLLSQINKLFLCRPQHKSYACERLYCLGTEETPQILRGKHRARTKVYHKYDLIVLRPSLPFRCLKPGPFRKKNLSTTQLLPVTIPLYSFPSAQTCWASLKICPICSSSQNEDQQFKNLICRIWEEK